MAVLGRPSQVAAQQYELRALNEQTVGAPTDNGKGAVTIRCECGRSDCETSLSLSRDLYEGIRQRRNQFLVLTGHEVPEVDRVIQHRGTISIVESVYIGSKWEPLARQPSRPLPAT